MESHVAASTIALLPALTFGSSKVAPYIIARNNVSFFPSGASVYGGTSGSKVCRFDISASTGAMLDLRSLCVSGTVFNQEAGKSIQFLSPSLSGCLSSARVIVSGVECSSCDHIGRAEHVLSLIQSDDDRRADFNAGFGLEEATSTDIHGKFTTQPILKTTHRNVTWKPRALGILQCDTYLPLSMLSGNLTLELTFLDDPAAGMNTTGELGTKYNVSELSCHVDVLALDAQFLTTLSQHLYSNGSLQLQYTNTNMSFYSILSSNSQISHARSASRLNQVMLTFGKTDIADSAEKAMTELLYPPGSALSARLQIGERRFPATENLTGPAKFYRNLMEAIGARAPSMSRAFFESTQFIAAFDLESAPKLQHTGVSTLNAPLSVFLEKLFTSSDPKPPNQMYLQTNSDVLLEITKRGVLVSI